MLEYYQHLSKLNSFCHLLLLSRTVSTDLVWVGEAIDSGPWRNP